MISKDGPSSDYACPLGRRNHDILLVRSRDQEPSRPFQSLSKHLSFSQPWGQKHTTTGNRSKKVPLKMLTSKSFPPQKKDAQKVSFPQKKGHQSLGPFGPSRLVACLRWPFLRFRGGSKRWLRSRSLRRPGLWGHRTRRVRAVQRNLGTTVFATVFGGVFLRGVGGWGASFESKCTSKFREFLGNTFPKKRIRSLTLI